MQMKRAWNIIIKRVGDGVCVHRNVCEAVGAAVCACDIMCVRTCGSVLLSAVWLTCIWAWGNKRSRGRGGTGGLCETKLGECVIWWEVGGWVWGRMGSRDWSPIQALPPSGIAGIFLFLVFFFTPSISSQSCSASCCSQNTSSGRRSFMEDQRCHIYTYMLRRVAK